MRRIAMSLVLTLFAASLAVGLPSRVTTSTLEPDDSLNWVFFDRSDDRPAAYADASAVLSAKAHERRRVRSGDDYLAKDLGPHPDDLAAVIATGAKLRTVSAWLNGVSIAASRAEIEAIRQLDHVCEVRPIARRQRYEPVSEQTTETSKNINNGKLSSAEDYGGSIVQLDAISVLDVHEMGYTGEGVTIGFLDDGFTSYLTHRAFPTLEVDSVWDFVDNDPEPLTGVHGTTVMAMVVANDTTKMIGAAPHASVLLARTEDSTNQPVSEYPAEEDYWVAGLEWAERNGADLISSSVSYFEWYDPLDEDYEFTDMDGNTAVVTRAADAAAARGLLVVNCIGNLNHAGDSTLTAPADGDSVLAVGACAITGDELAEFSCRGPSADGRIKPDVVAPGELCFTVSLYPGHGDTSYTNYASGTSYSTPLVAGVVALLLEARPDLDPATILGILRATASHASVPDNEWGWGIVNAKAAMDSALQWVGTPYESVQLPARPTLVSLYPNPTNGMATVTLDLPQAGELVLEVFDLLGRRLTVERYPVQAGRLRRALPLAGVASGVYFLRAGIGEWSEAKRIVLVR